MTIRDRALRLARGLLKLLREEGPAIPATPPTVPAAPAAEEIFYRAPSFQPSALPDSAREALRADNPRLLELRERYDAFSCPATDHVSWTDRYIRDELNLENFRGDNAYVWQLRGLRDLELAHIKYVLTTYYSRQIDRLGLLDKLGEDGLFGAYTFDVNGLTVSRDLLDSINEIYFLERHLRLSQKPGVRILDVGAGYGRLAHRLTTALPDLGGCLCTDAVAESTFLCEFYLRFRGAGGKAAAVPLFEIDQTLTARPAEIAVNVHSFSECTAAAVAWWLALLARHEVRHLMVVPNDGERILSREKDATQVDLDPVLEKAGYRRIVVEPKYLDESVQRFGVHSSYYHLFELG